MVMRSEEEATRAMGQHFNAMADMILSAIGTLYQDFGPHIHALETRTKRGIVRDLIKEQMIAYAENVPGFEFIKKGNAGIFGYQNDYIIKVKKLNDKYQACVNSTQTALNFDGNASRQGELFEDMEPTRLYLGYIPTENAPLNPPMFLVANDENRSMAWVIELKPSAPKPADEMPQEDRNAATAPRFRLKQPNTADKADKVDKK